MYVLTTEDSISVLFRIDSARLTEYPHGGIDKDIVTGTATMRLSSLSEEIKVEYRSPIINGNPIQKDDDFVERKATVIGDCVDHNSPYSRLRIGVDCVIVDIDRYVFLPLYIDRYSSQRS